jgi:hypothetical protein
MSQPVSNKSLSDPDVPAGNNGWDNANCDLIMRVNDVLGGVEGNRCAVGAVHSLAAVIMSHRMRINAQYRSVARHPQTLDSNRVVATL